MHELGEYDVSVCPSSVCGKNAMVERDPVSSECSD